MNECFKCGACCDYPEPWSKITLSKADIERIPKELIDFTDQPKMKKEGTRCIALTGTVGIDAVCSIHDIKPMICLNYIPKYNKRDCNMCRAHHSIKALQ